MNSDWIANQINQSKSFFENHPDATPTPRNNGTKSQQAIPPCFINWPNDNSKKKTFYEFHKTDSLILTHKTLTK